MQKADINKTKLKGELQLFDGKYKITDYEDGMMFVVGNHNFVFTNAGSIWVDNKYIGGVN